MIYSGGGTCEFVINLPVLTAKAVILEHVVLGWFSQKGKWREKKRKHTCAPTRVHAHLSLHGKKVIINNNIVCQLTLKGI